MCIILLSSSHPAYDLILLSNRDEFFSRPTRAVGPLAIDAAADLSISIGARPGGVEIVAGQDALRGGSWLGLCPSSGAFSALTNFRTFGEQERSALSRGHLVFASLTSEHMPEQFNDLLLRDARVAQVGGFSLLSGNLRHLDRGISVVDNQRHQSVTLKAPETTCALSNAAMHTPWPKTTMGKNLLVACIEASIKHAWTEERLIHALFDVLSTNTLVKPNIEGLAESIFIPAIKLSHDTYGTRAQTLWLVRNKQVHIVERTILATGHVSEVVLHIDLN